MSSPGDLRGGPGFSVVQAWPLERSWWAPWRSERWCARVAFESGIAGGDVMPLVYGGTRAEALEAAAVMAMEFVHGPDWRRIVGENEAAGL